MRRFFVVLVLAGCGSDSTADGDVTSGQDGAPTADGGRLPIEDATIPTVTADGDTMVVDGAEGAPTDGPSHADGAPADAKLPVDATPPIDAAPPCGTDAWATYGHDARRSSASDGCIGGPLAFKWRYVPAPPAGKTVKAVFNAIAQSDGAFLRWSSQNDPYLGTTSADRVTINGARAWTFNSGTDSDMGNWLSAALGVVLLNDDGLYFLDPGTGAKVKGTGVDNWGQSLFDAARFYVVNTSHVDGPKIYVGAYDSAATSLWTKNEYGTCRIDAADSRGGIALDGGVLFYAPSYSAGTGVTLGFGSGIYALDATTGAQKWYQATTPAGAISAASGRVFLAEGGKLVARNQSDGTVAWQAALPTIGAQAPVLAAGKVIVGTSAGVSAFDAATGAPTFNVPLSGVAVTQLTISFGGGCAGANVAQARGPSTTLAAALGSSTLVVTASDGVHVLALADGHEVWKGQIAQAVGVLHDPVVVGRRLFGIDDGGLLALDAP